MLESAANTYSSYSAERTPPQLVSAGSVGPLILRVEPGRELESLSDLGQFCSLATGVAQIQDDPLLPSSDASSALYHSERCRFFLPNLDLDLIRQLRVLFAEEKDLSESRLTPHAMTVVYITIIRAREQLPSEIPAPTYAADGEGGIRVEWKVGRREVRLIVPATETGTAYIYSRNELNSHLDRAISPTLLSKTLREIFVEQ